jgi:RNA polymerase sigma-32 factor
VNYAYRIENLGPYKVDPMKHVGVAMMIARRFRCRGLERQDINQEAIAALCAAARTFDPDKGFAFGTWAGKLIKYHLIAVVNLHNRTGHAGSQVRRSIPKVFKDHVKDGGSLDPEVLRPLLTSRAWKNPTNWECFIATDFVLFNEFSLDRHLDSQDAPSTNYCLLDTIEDEGALDRVEQPLVAKELQAVVDDTLEKMSPREREVALRRVLEFFGDPEHLQSIGDEWGLSRERIRQIETKVKGMLEKSLKGKLER